MKSYYIVKGQISCLLAIVIVGLSTSEMVLNSNSTKLKLACGGIIPVRGLGPQNSFVLDYTSGGGKKNGDKCLWTFDTTQNHTRYNIKAKITLISSGPADAHLSVLELKSAENNKDIVLSPHELKPNKPIYKCKQWNHNLYLSYSPSGKVSASGRYEFSLSFTILETDTEDSGSNDAFTAGKGMHAHSVAGKRNMYSMIVNIRKPRIKLTVNSFTANQNMSQCSRSDSLNVYEIGTQNIPKRLVRLCSKLQFPLSFTSQYPFLVTFYASARGNVGSEFQTWDWLRSHYQHLL